MCKDNTIRFGIKDLDFTAYRGKIAARLTDGREIIVPLTWFPDIKKLSLKQRNRWIVLDDQFFTFENQSKVYSIKDMMRMA